MHDDLVYGRRWDGSGGVHFDVVAGEMGEVGGRSQIAAGVVDAEERTLGLWTILTQVLWLVLRGLV